MVVHNQEVVEGKIVEIRGHVVSTEEDDDVVQIFTQQDVFSAFAREKECFGNNINITLK